MAILRSTSSASGNVAVTAFRYRRNRPLAVPQVMRRYTVREYGGPVGYHYYFRIAPGIVIHTYGSTPQYRQCLMLGP